MLAKSCKIYLTREVIMWILNSSIYGYNSHTKSYNLKRGINVTSDVPRKISWKGY